MPSIFLLLGVVILLLESAFCSEFSCSVNVALFLFNMYFVVSTLASQIKCIF